MSTTDSSVLGAALKFKQKIKPGEALSLALPPAPQVHISPDALFRGDSDPANVRKITV